MKTWLTIWLLIGCLAMHAQDSTAPKKFLFSGYLKDLQSFSFNQDFSEMISGNLLHNRINMKYKPFKGFVADLEMRNRLFWGEEIAQTPKYASGLKYPGESEDLSITWFELDNMLLYSNIDRLWAEYSFKKITARVGRQRINWGIGTLWNPNDIFNTYNFLDFDYEERPASDAVKLQYQLGLMSNAEIAIARTADSLHNTIAAAKYFTNRWNYDFQLLAGVYLAQPTLGFGWSGSIGDAGFKGELQYFFRHDNQRQQINVMTEGDYIFENNWYVNAGFLFNSKGIDEPIDSNGFVSFVLSPKQPMPTKYNFSTMVSKEITPLLSGSLGLVYAPGTNLLIVLPSLKYNLATNHDADLVSQCFFATLNQQFQSVNTRFFLRLKWSF